MVSESCSIGIVRNVVNRSNTRKICFHNLYKMNEILIRGKTIFLIEMIKSILVSFISHRAPTKTLFDKNKN